MKCLLCDKPRTGNKYCNSCKQIARDIANQRFAVKQRLRNLSPCLECNEIYTNTKYCRKCRQVVRRRKLKIHHLGLCTLCKKEPRMSSMKAIRHCIKCYRKKVDKLAMENKEDKDIYVNPKWLRRGTISNRTGDY